MNIEISALLGPKMTDLYELMDTFTLIIPDMRHDQMGTIMTSPL